MKSRLGVLYWAFKHKRTPWYAKALIALVLSYAVSPIDLIPDFIPVLGYLDDLILIPAGVALAIKFIPEDIIAECQAKQNLQNDIIKTRLLGAMLVVGIWFLIAYLVLKAAGLLYRMLYEAPSICAIYAFIDPY